MGKCLVRTSVQSPETMIKKQTTTTKSKAKKEKKKNPNKKQPSVVQHSCNPRAGEAEAGSTGLLGHSSEPERQRLDQ